MKYNRGHHHGNNRDLSFKVSSYHTGQANSGARIVQRIVQRIIQRIVLVPRRSNERLK